MPGLADAINAYIEVTKELIAFMDCDEPEVETITSIMDRREAAFADIKAVTEGEQQVATDYQESLKTAAELDSKLKALFEAYVEKLRQKVRQNNQGSRAVAGYRQAPAATYSTMVDRMQ